MKPTYNELDPAAHALYAQLLESVIADVDGGEIPVGTLVSKVIRARTYWYAQYAEVGRQRQVYLGPESEALDERLDALRALWAARREDAKSRAVLVSMLLAAGVQGLDNPSSKVLELLERHGVFRVGGVLVGSHAFAAYGPMLGVAWGAAWKTADHRLRVALAERADPPAALAESALPFRGVPALNPKSPSTSFSVRGRQLSVDVLTPLVDPQEYGPIFLPQLNVAAQPLRFLDYLVEDHQPAALVTRSGILVNVPTPARYALHKLVVSRERHVGEQAKVRKDLGQAAQLIELLAEIRPGDLVLAWEALRSRGPGWRKRFEASRRLLPAHVNGLLTQTVGCVKGRGI